MTLVSVISCVCIAACYVLVLKWPGTLRVLPSRVPKKSSWAWSVAYLAVLVFLGIYDLQGHIQADAGQEWLLGFIFTLCSVASLWNDQIRDRLGKIRFPKLFEFGSLALAAYLTFICIELPSNPYMLNFWVEGLLIEVVIIFVFMLTLHFLFQRSGLGAAIVAIAFELAGLAEYFVVEFKNVPIMASDVIALGTAVAVSGNYEYLLKGIVLTSFTVLALIVFLLSITPRITNWRPRKVVVNLMLAVVLGAGAFLGITKLDFADMFGVYYNAWIPLTSYWREGFVTSFLNQLQSFEPEKPKGYTNKKAKNLLASYVEQYENLLGETEARVAAQDQFEQEQPTVIVVMNESFADLSVYDDLEGTYTGPQWLNSFEGALAKGLLYVSPFGGGTCNSEWEFLTGATMAYLGSGVYPYMVYDMSGTNNLAATFKSLGYTTTAIHPNLATNWYRNIVYPAMGFDDFLDITDFIGASRLRNMVTDEATYDKIIEMLKTDDSPQFILDVTMQNHGGYDTDALPDDMVKEYQVLDYESPRLDEYLALIDESDRALGEFVDELSELSRPVVLVFFGDHQPSLASTYNNWLFASDDGTLDHEERARTTCYMIYANYNVAGTTTTAATTDSCCSFLGAQMMQMIGGPLTDFQKSELVMQELGLSIINELGYRDADGQWHEFNSKSKASSGAAALAKDLQVLQYYELFSDGVHYQTGSGYSGTVWGRLN